MHCNVYESSFKSIKTDVPHKSISAPLLCSMYINVRSTINNIFKIYYV